MTAETETPKKPTWSQDVLAMANGAILLGPVSIQGGLEEHTGNSHYQSGCSLGSRQRCRREQGGLVTVYRMTTSCSSSTARSGSRLSLALQCGIIDFAVGRNELYLLRQDSKLSDSKGLNIHRLDPAMGVSQVVAHIGFRPAAMQLSPDGRHLYLERHDPFQSQIVAVRHWR
jgi:hypothetical protein